MRGLTAGVVAAVIGAGLLGCGRGGRCRVSRVSSSFGEPLYGIAATASQNLSQLITTPGNDGNLVIPIDVSNLLDGTITISVTLTNGSGNSYATTIAETKDTTPPPLSVSIPPYVNGNNQSNFAVNATGEKGDYLTYSLTDGTTTDTVSKWFTGNGTYSNSSSVSNLKDGSITFTFTETDPAGNPSTYTVTLPKRTTAPAAQTSTLNSASDTGSSNSDYITQNNQPAFTTTTASGITTTLYLNGTAYTGQKLADGSYSIVTVACDVANNCTSSTNSKTLQIDATAPSGYYTVSGGRYIAGQYTTASQTPNLALAYSDASGIASMQISTNGGQSYGAATAYSSSPQISLASGDGTYSVVVRLTDTAGNTGSYTLPVRLDTTAPAITAALSAPQATAGYDGTADATFSDSATDAGSGVASIVVKLDGTAIAGSTIDLDHLTAGSHTLTITATDGVGNASTATLTFALHPSVAGITNAVSEGQAASAITSAEASKLSSILNNSANTRSINLSNFQSEVKAASTASSPTVTSAEATLLTNWASDLQNRISAGQAARDLAHGKALTVPRVLHRVKRRGARTVTRAKRPLEAKHRRSAERSRAVKHPRRRN